MKKAIAMLFVSAALATSAIAEDSKTTTQVPGGTVEKSSDQTYNPLTGNETSSQEVVSKDQAGKTTAVRKAKVKRDRKSGKTLEKSSSIEKMDSEGNTTESTRSEESFR